MSQIITDLDQLEDIVGQFSERDAFAFDVETTGEFRGIPSQNETLWISLATQGLNVVIPMGHPNGYRCVSKATWRKNKVTGKREDVPAVFDEPPKQLRPSQVFDALEPLLFSDRLKIAHNAPFDLLSVARYYKGNYPPPPYADTIVGAWITNENRMLGLKKLIEANYGLVYDTEEVGKCIELHPFGQVADYSLCDAAGTWLLWQDFEPLITSEGLEEVWELEMGVLECLLHMQSAGAPVNRGALMRLRTELRGQIETCKAEVYRAAGKEFNLGSVPQKQKILYEERGLKPRKFTKKKAASTDAEALSFYQGKDAVVDAILAYQEVDKIHSTYVEGYLGNPEAGKPTQIFNDKIYPSFKQYGTVTGRFSCSAPNVQNWPRPDTYWGKALRDLILCPEGFQLLVADYAQIEQRILAHFAGRGALWQGFWDGIDAHTMTASMVFGVAPEDVTKPMRQVAKAIAFAINYGAGAAKVAAMCGNGTTERKAKQILATHEKAFPEVYEYQARLMRTVKARRPEPYLRTLSGRKRRLPNLLSRIQEQRSQAERQVVNSHIQGSNADMTKMAMVRFNKTRLPGMQLILTVHDELAALCPIDIAQEGARVLHEAMAGNDMQILSVPVTTEVKIVDRWSEAK